MSDRFKFRIWDIEKRKYIDIQDYNRCQLNICFNSTDNMYFDDAKNYIIEQCTGLKDKNGKLIYEGDICIPAKDMADKAGEVYRAESGAYNIKGKMKSGMEYDFGIYWHHYMYEVIGNIHENADLLGE